MNSRVKQNVILILISIAVLLSLFFIFVSPKYLSDYMVGVAEGKAYAPKRRADSYMSSSVGHRCWRYELKNNEKKSVEEYIEKNSEVWHALSGDINSAIQNYLWESEKIEFNEISVDGAECCIVRLRGRSAEFLNAEKKDEESYVTDRYAVFIYDKLNLRYYCVFLSNR